MTPLEEADRRFATRLGVLCVGFPAAISVVLGLVAATESPSPCPPAAGQSERAAKRQTRATPRQPLLDGGADTFRHAGTTVRISSPRTL